MTSDDDAIHTRDVAREGDDEDARDALGGLTFMCDLCRDINGATKRKVGNTNDIDGAQLPGEL